MQKTGVKRQNSSCAIPEQIGDLLPGPVRPHEFRPEEYFNKMLDTHPSNHVYSLHQGKLSPGKKLARRASFIKRFYSAPMESLLDIGCAQGYFALDAAQRFPRARTLGVDVDDKYIQVNRQISEYLGLPNAQFVLCHLHELSEQLDRYGGPFQTVLFVNTYHYAYFGSRKDSFAYRDHDQIFRLLRKVACEQIIFSSPLEIHDCPRFIQEIAPGADYHEETILRAARNYFQIEKIGHLAKRPAYVFRVPPRSERV